VAGGREGRGEARVTRRCAQASPAGQTAFPGALLPLELVQNVGTGRPRLVRDYGIVDGEVVEIVSRTEQIRRLDSEDVRLGQNARIDQEQPLAPHRDVSATRAGRDAARQAAGSPATYATESGARRALRGPMTGAGAKARRLMLARSDHTSPTIW
jgi:hypothetical protein